VNEQSTQTNQPTPGSNEPSLEQIAFRWQLLKAAEEKARKDRIQCESDMLPFLDQRAEGATTTTLKDGTKITVKNSVGRSMDWIKWKEIAPEIPPKLQCVKLKDVLDEAHFRQLMSDEPEIYKKIAAAVTTTPHKPGITVKSPEKNNGF
jgi:hypothetical protein